ncbi:MAG: hypothetical protein LIO45_06015 [Clostridiales bacterium]|nr:hypothetical protein [Clostridiales bacterium]
MEENHTSILRDGINAIATLARKPLEGSREIITREIYGEQYYMKDGTMCQLDRPDLDKPDTKFVGSLEALAAMIQHEALMLRFPAAMNDSESCRYCADLFVQVEDEKTVRCRTAANNLRYEAFNLYVAKAEVVTDFRPGRKYGHEEFMILLRSQFQPSEDREYLLATLASVTGNATVKSEDNGLAQSVSVNKGICNVQMQAVKSIVKLRPYRTFHEVQQPESEFLVRLSLEEDGSVSVALHEADGGMWRLDARREVAERLRTLLADETSNGSVVVTA